MLQAVKQQAAVGQAGECIVQCLIFQHHLPRLHFVTHFCKRIEQVFGFNRGCKRELDIIEALGFCIECVRDARQGLQHQAVQCDEPDHNEYHAQTGGYPQSLCLCLRGFS